MTFQTIPQDGRTADIASVVAALGPNAIPPTLTAQPSPMHPADRRTEYDPFTLLGWIVARFEQDGQLPAESVPKDIEGAVAACRQLLTSLGMRPVLVSKRPEGAR